jgi:hypothetical protein
VCGYTHSARRGAGCRRARVDSPRPIWAGTPQQNGAIFAVTVGMDSNARPTAGTGDAVAATPVLDCDAAEREASNSRDHSHGAAHAALEGAGPFRVARRSRPHHGANRAAPSRRVPASSWPSRPHAHHSSPHPRAVQLLLLDQQIASALPLAQ